jgi:prevent-host-death family protein
MQSIALSEAKAKLSQIIRDVRSSGEPMLVTVDGEPAAVIEPAPGELRKLTAQEVARYRLIEAGLLATDWGNEPFDAMELVRAGRR